MFRTQDLPKYLRHFGEPVVLLDLDLPNGRAIQGVVDLGVHRNRIGEISSEIQDPGFEAIDTDIAGLQKQHICVIRSKNYLVAELLPDGTGMTRVTVVEDTPDAGNGVFR